MFSVELLVQLMVVVLLLLRVVVMSADPLIVNTLKGRVQGKLMQTNNSLNVYSFLGIPYARPPKDSLRFQPPVDPARWYHVHDATYEKSMCTQVDILSGQINATGSEDCLYLNVFTKEISNTRYPVMVYFHGGGFVTGSSSPVLYGPKYLLDHDVVLVTANYRLGALGFLSTNDLVIPGNMGLKDQTKVLHWVQQNIHKFGGDPNLVTIFGQSAGSASVNYHMLSPLSKDLFHRAISQSGSALNPWAYMDAKKAKKNAKRLAGHFGCSQNKSEDILSCLHKQNASEIIEADKIYREWGFDPPVPFRPVVEPKHEGAFLIESPDVLMTNGRGMKVPWMVGGVAQEGCIKTSALVGREDNSYSELNDHWQDIAEHTLFYDDIFTHDDVRNNASKMFLDSAIRTFYFGEKKIDRSAIENATNMYSDVWFDVGKNNAIMKKFKWGQGRIYSYYFAYKGALSLSRIFSVGDQTDYGVCHCDDLLYLFPIRDIFGVSTTPEDANMIQILTKLWVSFAKRGYPLMSDASKELTVEWKPVQSVELEYLLIQGPRNLTMSDNLLQSRFQFWRSLTRRY